MELTRTKLELAEGVVWIAVLKFVLISIFPLENVLGIAYPVFLEKDSIFKVI